MKEIQLKELLDECDRLAGEALRKEDHNLYRFWAAEWHYLWMWCLEEEL